MTRDKQHECLLMHLVISADFSDWLYLAVKLGKGLTAREILGEKKHKILWCFGDLEGVFCGGQCLFCFGLYLGKEEVTGSNPVGSSKKTARFRAGFVMSHQHGFSPFANAIFLPHRKFFRRGPRCLPQPKIANFHPRTPNRPA